MTEEEHELLIRKALREPKWWAEITAQDSDAAEVLATLQRWLQRVDDDLRLSKLKVSEVEANKAAGIVSASVAAKTRAEQFAWRRKAEGFRTVLRDKIDELSIRLGSPAKVRKSTRDYVMRAEHAETRAKYRKKLRILAAAVYLHQSDEINDGDLYSLLDDLELPYEDDGTGKPYDLTLRQSIEAGKFEDATKQVRELFVKELA